LESEAVLAIVSEIERGRWVLVTSDAIDEEIDEMADPQRLERVRNSIPRKRQHIRFDDQIIARALALESLGFLGMDALHVAAAEGARADVFLTTDDRLLRRAKRQRPRLRVAVENPLTWLQNVLKE